jgi:hypothetical protein
MEFSFFFSFLVLTFYHFFENSESDDDTSDVHYCAMKIGLDALGWINVAQDRDQWRTLRIR